MRTNRIRGIEETLSRPAPRTPVQPRPAPPPPKTSLWEWLLLGLLVLAGIGVWIAVTPLEELIVYGALAGLGVLGLVGLWLAYKIVVLVLDGIMWFERPWNWILLGLLVLAGIGVWIAVTPLEEVIVFGVVVGLCIVCLLALALVFWLTGLIADWMYAWECRKGWNSVSRSGRDAQDVPVKRSSDSEPFSDDYVDEMIAGHAGAKWNIFYDSDSDPFNSSDTFDSSSLWDDSSDFLDDSSSSMDFMDDWD